MPGIIEVAANATLMLVSGYAFKTLDPAEYCYGFALSAFCFVHGLMGLIRTIGKTDPNQCNTFHMVVSSIMETLPLPIANFQLYLASSKANVAYLHVLSIFPFLYDVTSKLNDDCDDTTETLKDVALLGSAGSAVYLAQQENKPIYGVIGVFVIVMHYVSLIAQNMFCELSGEIELLVNAVIVFLMTRALTGGGGGGGGGDGGGGDGGQSGGGGGEESTAQPSEGGASEASIK